MVKQNISGFAKGLLYLYCIQFLLTLFLALSVLVVHRSHHLQTLKNIEQASMEQLNFSASEFHGLIIIDKEFTYLQKLYDIKNITQVKGMYVVLAVNDVQEKTLKSLADNIASKSRTNAMKVLKSCHASVSYFEEPGMNRNLFIFSDDSHSNIGIKHFAAPVLDVASPPPDSIILPS